MAVATRRKRRYNAPKFGYDRWLRYDQAKYVVQSARKPPTSRDEYYRWHEQNEPIGLPKAPHTVYKEWAGWNDFLGTDNIFIPNRPVVVEQFRSYYDAQRYIHTLKLSTTAEYKDHINSGMMPDDIPRMPNKVYAEWVDWPTWLGVSLRSRVESMANVKQCVALCTMADQAPNIVRVLVCQNGIEELKRVLEDSGSMKVLKMYEWKVETAEAFQRVVNTFGSDQGGNEYLVSNMNALVYELDSCMLWWS